MDKQHITYLSGCKITTQVSEDSLRRKRTHAVSSDIWASRLDSTALNVSRSYSLSFECWASRRSKRLILANILAPFMRKFCSDTLLLVVSLAFVEFVEFLEGGPRLAKCDVLRESGRVREAGAWR